MLRRRCPLICLAHSTASIHKNIESVTRKWFFHPFFVRLIWFVPIRIKCAECCHRSNWHSLHLPSDRRGRLVESSDWSAICRQNKKKQKHARQFEWGCHSVDAISIIYWGVRVVGRIYTRGSYRINPYRRHHYLHLLRHSGNGYQTTTHTNAPYEYEKMRLDLNGFTWQQQRQVDENSRKKTAKWAGKNNDAVQVDNVDKLQSRIWVYGRIIWFEKHIWALSKAST